MGREKAAKLVSEPLACQLASLFPLSPETALWNGSSCDRKRLPHASSQKQQPRTLPSMLLATPFFTWDLPAVGREREKGTAFLCAAIPVC